MLGRTVRFVLGVLCVCERACACGVFLIYASLNKACLVALFVLLKSVVCVSVCVWGVPYLCVSSVDSPDIPPFWLGSVMHGIYMVSNEPGRFIGMSREF